MKGLSAIVPATIAALLIAAAAPAARAQQAPLQDKPFAEHKIVLQLSGNDPRKRGLVLSVASNLVKFYDPPRAGERQAAGVHCGGEPVQVGVAQILFLTENGSTLVRP
jgi:hypothetical protein